MRIIAVTKVNCASNKNKLLLITLRLLRRCPMPPRPAPPPPPVLQSLLRDIHTTPARENPLITITDSLRQLRETLHGTPDVS